MQTVLILLKPRTWGFRHRLQGGVEGRTWVRILLALIGFLFWFGIFAGSYRVLHYFQGVEGFGDILAVFWPMGLGVERLSRLEE
ncbi:MAG TPA: hypothetical protein EYP19_10710 [Desulfobacterales bacterium]|nr:hypothetical protein [Desulfobacterales bacterium]